ncbi:hypothetical protein SY88_05550 [Clostridiales bacterium PH28_bin88]|nr:hypothetical protein SY88_05550 [Clostridiales bacterium PH28_bin88]
MVSADYRLDRVVDNVFALAVWDGEWQSFNNCYILLRRDGVQLIDSGKAEHITCLVQALAFLGKSPKDVTDIVVTHGHKDHFGGSFIFPNASKLIHTNDLDMLPSNSGFIPILKNEGLIRGLAFVLVKHHTKGSIALYEHERKVLFCGDFLGFFGQTLPPEGLVSQGTELRKWFVDLVSKLRHEERLQLQFDQFILGIDYLKNFNAHFLCSGHGAVLHNNIESFFSDIARVSIYSG